MILVRPPRGRRRTLASRFCRDGAGVAAVEFALILPVLLLLYIGSIEASSLITVDRRVNIISGTVGDLVARWNPDLGAIPSSALEDYFEASEGILYPYANTGLKQVVSLVAVDDDGTTKVLWSCGYNGGTKRVADSEYTSLPANMNLIARGGRVVASETWYPYKPVLGLVFTEPLNLYQQGFYIPRYEKAIVGPSC
jgi:Flp pilus assembly protein TadG